MELYFSGQHLGSPEAPRMDRKLVAALHNRPQPRGSGGRFSEDHLARAQTLVRVGRQRFSVGGAATRAECDVPHGEQTFQLGTWAHFVPVSPGALSDLIPCLHSEGLTSPPDGRPCYVTGLHSCRSGRQAASTRTRSSTDRSTCTALACRIASMCTAT